MHRRALATLLATTLLAGCSTPALTPMGRGVMALGVPPGPGCRPLGTVTGEGRGPFDPGALVDYATNDARNRAAELGATHVYTTPPALGYSSSYANGHGSGGVSSATLTGTAYRCEGVPAAVSVPPRGIYAAINPPPVAPTAAPAPAYTPWAEAPAAPPPVAPTTGGLGGRMPGAAPSTTEQADVAVRATLDAHRREVLACAERDLVVVHLVYAPSGETTLHLTGDLAGSPQEACVRDAVGPLRVHGVSRSDTVIHVVR